MAGAGRMWCRLAVSLLGLALAGCAAVPTAAPSGVTLPPASTKPLQASSVIAARMHFATPAPSQATEVAFLSPNLGWAVVTTAVYSSVYQVLQTKDGGATWIPGGRIASQPVSLQFVNAEDGFAATNGPLYATLDGGRTWHVRGFTSVSTPHFVSPSLGVAVAADQVVLTQNGGVTWTTVLAPAGVRFQDVSAPTASEFFAIGTGTGGPVLFRSTDSGATWSPLFTSTSAPALAAAYRAYLAQNPYYSSPTNPRPTFRQGNSSVFFTGPRTGWLSLFDGSFLSTMYAETEDGGETWRFAWGNYGCAMGCNGMGDALLASGFLGANHVWRYQGQSVERSTDGGRTWSDSTLPLGMAAQASVTAADYVNATRGYLATNAGLYVTRDGGATWQRLWPRTVGPFKFVSLQKGGAGFAVGQNLPYLLWSTDNGGRTWTPEHQFTTPIEAMGRLAGKGGWVYDGRVLWETGDGGHTWKQVATRFPAGHSDTLVMATLRYGWDVVWPSPSATTTLAQLAPVLYATHNGGTSWQRLRQLQLGPSGLDPVGESEGWLLTAKKLLPSHKIVHGHKVLTRTQETFKVEVTVNGGRTFREVGTLPGSFGGGEEMDSYSLSGVAIPGGQDIWLTGDGGRHWSEIRLPTDVSIQQVDAVSPQELYLVTGEGQRFKTSDGGRNWQEIG